MENFFSTLASGVFIALVSSFVTVRLSLRKFRTEKWWERKADTYSKIIEALYQSKRFTDRHLGEAFGERTISEDHKSELLAAAHVASAEIERITNVGAFLLSEKAMARLAQYEKAQKHASDTRDWGEYLERDWEAVSTCLTDMIAIAKEDLAIQPIVTWWGKNS